MGCLADTASELMPHRVHRRWRGAWNVSGARPTTLQRALGTADPEPVPGTDRTLRRERPRVNQPSAGSPSYVAETVLAAACHLDPAPADATAMGDALKPLAISQTAMTISCSASGAMKTPSESPNMLPSGAMM